MNKKISQFDSATSFNNGDLIPILQNGENKKVAKEIIVTSLSDTFVTNSDLSATTSDIEELSTKVDDNYNDLASKITTGDSTVTSNLSSNISSYYDILNNKIITLETKHDGDILSISNSVESWEDTIANKSTLSQLQDATNRLTITENLVTELANAIANADGATGSVPGFHTQASSTILPLTGYSKGSNADALTTTDTLNQALAKLENQIDAVNSNSSSLPVIKIGETTAPSDGTIYTSGKVKEDYLKKSGDTATGLIKFLNGIQCGSTFSSGWTGSGASLYPLNNKWNLEVDDLLVRGNMTVNNLTINEIKAVGGDILVTIADLKCTSVEDTGDGYKCYFDTDGGNKYNEFLVNDQAICQKFDGTNVKRYWRMVTSVGTDYIILSKNICEAGSGTPSGGDNIIQLGHRVESDSIYNSQMDDRRTAIFISAKGDNSPSITFYDNINDFTLLNKDRTVIGKNSKFVGTLYQTSSTNDTVRVPVYKGIWSAEAVYNYYDQVTYNGSLWICMGNGITSVPVVGNSEWQLQVSKGDTGTAGDDVAKWVEITGNRLFLYTTPDYSDTPTPTQLVLTCNTYGLTNETYSWSMLTDPVESLGNSKNITIPYNLFSTKTVTIRCTVTNSDSSIYYDDYQLAKLSNGAEGEDSYYVDLTNNTVAVPFDSSGNTPLINLSTIYTQIYAYKGTTATTISSISYETVYGTATVTIDGNKVTLATLSTVSAIIRLSIKLSDNNTITKDWYINKIHNGSDGFDGTDAAYIVVAGIQTFKYASGTTTPSPESITLSTFANGIESPVYSWYWSLVGSNDWTKLTSETLSTLTVSPTGEYFSTNDEVSFKCEATSINGGVIYYDIITINKLKDGEDGESAYHGILTNEVHTVAASFNGVVSSTEFSSAITDIKLWKGVTLLANTDFSVTVTAKNGTGTYVLDSTNMTLQCTGLTTDTAVWQVNFLVDSILVDVCDFTVTKAKGGAVGNNQVTIYCMTTGTPNRPLLTTRPSSSGTSSNGYIWYNDPTYSSSYSTWSSTGSLDPNTDGGSIVINTSTGYRWTTPVKISGIDGTPGATGATGATGPAGASGVDGPGLNYRGTWVSGNSYGWTGINVSNVRDVVLYNSKYYMWNSYYRGQVLTASSSNGPASSYTTVDGTYGAYWVQFGTSFESIATGLLFSTAATIAGWEFTNEYIYSQSNTMRLDGRTTPLNNIHLAAGANAASAPGSAPFRVDTSGNMTCSSGLIGPWTVSSDRMKYVASTFNNVAKLFIGSVDSGTTETANARITALGIDAAQTISGSTSTTTDIHNMFIDNVSSSNKKTSMILKTSSGAKNTALASFGNMTVTGDLAQLGNPLVNTLPSESSGFDHNLSLFFTASNVYLPTTESLHNWFGNNPNAGLSYYSGMTSLGTGLDAQNYDLYVANFSTGTVRVYGNSSGNNDTSSVSGTPLYGAGVILSGQGYIDIAYGHCVHFKKVRRWWVSLGTY